MARMPRVLEGSPAHRVPSEAFGVQGVLVGAVAAWVSHEAEGSQAGRCVLGETAAESEGSVSLRERVLGRIRQELALHEASAPRKWFPLSREAILYPALLAEAQRQVEKHGPMRAQDDCRMCSIDCGCTTSYTPMDLCPVVLAWARVFGEGE